MKMARGAGEVDQGQATKGQGCQATGLERHPESHWEIMTRVSQGNHTNRGAF